MNKVLSSICLTLFLSFGVVINSANAEVIISKDEAKEYINLVLNDVDVAINSSKNDKSRFDAFLKLFDERADVEVISRYIIGRDWGGLSAKDQQFAVSQIKKYLAKKYGAQFSYFTESEFEIIKVYEKKKGVYFFISTQVSHKKDGKFEIEWRLSTKSNEPQLLDIIIEGVSMLTIEKSEIQARIDKTKGKDKIMDTMRSLY